ncbi:hypothetical protein HRH25_16215 [Flavisolibacter sp. BT320]|nr:hypothetical protein [Flavisolibacter longurius]
MFNWQDHKSSLTAMVGLSYNSGNGLKVTDVASEVGQGWSLVAGGVITRMQVGEPDDQVQHGNGQSEKYLKKYPNGYLYANKNPYDGCPTALTKYPLYKAKNQLYKQYNEVAEDKQLDFFAFQFNGKSGMFVLNAAENSPNDPTFEETGLSLGDTKIKIKYHRSASPTTGKRTTIQFFTIQDVDGLIYKFATHGLTRLLDTKFCDRSGRYIKEQPNFKDGKVYYQNDFDNSEIQNPEIITSWYLTEIQDPLTLRKVEFFYQIDTIDATAGADLSYNQTGDYATVTFKKSKGTKPRLASMVYPDGHLVLFHYDKPRVDLPVTYALTSLDIKYGTRFISKYLVNTTYFILNRYGTPVTDYQKRVARLCLKSVQKLSPDLKEDSPPYIFDYYTGSDTQGDYVPPPFHFKKDIWGYYNGEESKSTHGLGLPAEVWDLKKDDVVGLCFLREIAGQNNTYTTDFFNVKPEYAKNGLLKQIVYPTGGTLSYSYKQNKQNISSQLLSVGGVHVFETRSTDGGYSNDCNNPIITSYRFALDQAGESSSLWGWETPQNKITMTSYYEPMEKKYKWPIFGGCGIAGCCVYNYMYPGILSIQQATNLSDVMQVLTAISPVLGVVGSVSTVMNAIKIFSATAKFLTIAGVIIDVIVGVYTLIQTCWGNHTKTTEANLYYNYDLNSGNPLPTQFKRVEIIEGSGTAGKTVHEFTSDAFYAIWEPSNNTFSSKQRFATWAYGLPLTTTLFKSNGDTVRKTSYKYDKTNAKILLKEYSGKSQGEANNSELHSNLISCKCNVKKTSSQKSSDFNTPAVYNANYILEPGNTDMDVDMHGYYTGRMNLIEVSEKLYNESNPSVYVETKTSYTYNNGDAYYSNQGNYAVLTIGNFEVATVTTTKSNGDELVKMITYPTNLYSGDPLMNVLVQNNILTVPVQTETYFTKGGFGPREYIESSRTEFIQVGSGAIKPLRQLEMRYSQPNIPLSNDFTEVKRFSYDSDGNLVKVVDEGNRVLSNLYDYDDKYVTATLINADVVNTKVAYTSFETGKLGGWTLTGSATYPTSKVTGDRAFQLTSGGNTLTAAALSPSMSYRLTYWATAPLSVSGSGTLVVSEPTISGFTYYEYEFPAGVTSVSLTGNGIIDELRLYPKNARMATVTYDPIIGKTSECDANNRIIYYEYDNLGRMRFIKDEKRNIVKMYEYNNVSKQTGCPAIYYSRYTEETFTKNCGPNFISRPFKYTIPAAKYTSTISQEDADAKVQQELLTQGQAAADAGALCMPVNCNDAQSVVVSSEDCPAGYKGVAITYTVPAGRYCDTLSKDSVNKLALEELNANAQAFVNNAPNHACVPDYDPDWEADENAPTQCMWENGQAYIFRQATDVNPNSPTYGSTQWKNTGESGTCPPPANCTIQYYNGTGFAQTIIYSTPNSGGLGQSFSLPANSSGSISLAPGTYDVSITNSSNGVSYTYDICIDYFYYGTSAAFSDVSITCAEACGISIY